MNKQAVRHSVWYIGGRRKRRRQTGEFFPVGALAVLILGTLGGVVIKIYLVVGNADAEDIYRNKILVRQKVTPERVTLPNGRYFSVRYERVSRKNLPSNVTIRRSWTIGPKWQRKRRTQQFARILGSVFNLGTNLLSSGALKKGLDIGSRAITSEIGRKVIDEGIKHAPELYSYGTKKIKDKYFKKALGSDIANYTVKQAQKELFNWQHV